VICFLVQKYIPIAYILPNLGMLFINAPNIKMRVKVLEIIEDVAVVELLDTEYSGKTLKISTQRIRPDPTIGDTLWHVEHHFWEIDFPHPKEDEFS
jgi:hypothetical protein